MPRQLRQIFLCLLIPAAVALLPAATHAAEDDWSVELSGPLTVKARPKKGTSVTEIWAEGEIAADARDVQEVLTDPESFSRFMPFVKESRFVGPPNADGSRVVYTRIDPPYITSRDYVTRMLVEQKLDDAGAGQFKQSWRALPDHLPKRHNVIRLVFNEGSWTVTPVAPGRCRGTYQFAVDPSGWIPNWVAKIGQNTSIKDTFLAVEKEAQKRAAKRKSAKR